MNRDLRIVFMGTPEFAVHSLMALLDHEFNVVGVVTSPDRPSGRGQKLKSSAVKQFAMTNGLTVLQPTNLKNDRFNEALKALEPNLQIVVAFRMLPKIVWNLPEFGTFNLHASLLPNYRGAAPINWAIINGETRTGVTTFFIDEKIDTGELILQQEVAIDKDDTAGILHDKLMITGAELVIQTVKLIEQGTPETTRQKDELSLKPAPKLNKDNCKINWTDTPYNIYNKIRGLAPYPAAWCYLKNGDEEITAKIYKARPVEVSHDHKTSALIITKNELKVAVKNGYIIIDEIQLAGKRRMPVKSLLNGYRFQTNAKML
ncbi:MAG: methionyl-tRNA formyltransferase [Flavobacteriaceae bacterium]|nr:methionyl-tRNA formyltransferase [Flavobacteriaceae bacterium]